MRVKCCVCSKIRKRRKIDTDTESKSEPIVSIPSMEMSEASENQIMQVVEEKP